MITQTTLLSDAHKYRILHDGDEAFALLELPKALLNGDGNYFKFERNEIPIDITEYKHELASQCKFETLASMDVLPQIRVSGINIHNPINFLTMFSLEKPMFFYFICIMFLSLSIGFSFMWFGLESRIWSILGMSMAIPTTLVIQAILHRRITKNGWIRFVYD